MKELRAVLLLGLAILFCVLPTVALAAEDFDPPVISDVSMDSPGAVVRAGDTLHFYVTVTDESEITTACIYFQYIDPNGGSHSLNSSEGEYNSDTGVYTLSLTIDDTVSEGRYTVIGLGFGDSNYNYIEISPEYNPFNVDIHSICFTVANPDVITVPVTVNAVSLTLSGEIGLNFKLTIPDTITNDRGAKAVILYKGENTEIPFSSIISFSDEYVFTKQISAKDIANPVRIKIVDANGKAYPIRISSGFCENNEFSYSVTDYCAAASGSSNAKLQTLVEALQNYGYYARAYLGGTGAAPDLASKVDMSGITAKSLSDYAMKQTGKVTGLELKSMSLSLKSETEINLSFKLASGQSIGKYTFTCDGKKLTPALNGDGTRYVVKIPNVAAKDLDKEYTVIVKRGSAKMTIKCSALSYAELVLRKSNNQNQINTVKALKLYNDAANAYFEK